ncbi:MAG TPA: S8/S53 family peptidase [Blastocatellia bacterium]|nr:S8/S53 family peptidase [Blastocatellia bacterium]
MSLKRTTSIMLWAVTAVLILAGGIPGPVRATMRLTSAVTIASNTIPRAGVLPEAGEARVILRLKGDRIASGLRLDAMEALRQPLGLGPHAVFYSTRLLEPGDTGSVFLVRSRAFTMDALLATLRTDPSVLFAEPDRQFQVLDRVPRLAPSAGLSSQSQPWYAGMPDFIALGGPNLQSAFASHPTSGGPAIIVNLDSGIDTTDPRMAAHQPAQGWGVNWTNDASTPDTVVQDPGLNGFSHGLAVAGQEIKAIDDDPTVRFWNERVLAPNMTSGGFSFTGLTSWVIEALSDVKSRMKNDASFRVAAINMSLVGFQSTALRDLIATMQAPVFICSGNGDNDSFVGVSLQTDPVANAVACYAAMLPNCAAVGALDDTGQTATSYSNFGPVPIWAPGSVNGPGLNGTIIAIEGTSFAAPTAAGIAAEVALRKGMTDPRAIIQQIQLTAPVTSFNLGGGTQQAILIKADKALTGSVQVPPADGLSFVGATKYHTVSQQLTLKVKLVQTALQPIAHDLIVVPGLEASGPKAWFGALDPGAGGTVPGGLSGPNPGQHVTISSKGGGLAVSGKIKHPAN